MYRRLPASHFPNAIVSGEKAALVFGKVNQLIAAAKELNELSVESEISEDPNNALGVGSDNKLFLPATEGFDFAAYYILAKI